MFKIHKQRKDFIDRFIEESGCKPAATYPKVTHISVRELGSAGLLRGIYVWNHVQEIAVKVGDGEFYSFTKAQLAQALNKGEAQCWHHPEYK